jgi:hypothetical protein
MAVSLHAFDAVSEHDQLHAAHLDRVTPRADVAIADDDEPDQLGPEVARPVRILLAIDAAGCRRRGATPRMRVRPRSEFDPSGRDESNGGSSRGDDRRGIGARRADPRYAPECSGVPRTSRMRRSSPRRE